MAQARARFLVSLHLDEPLLGLAADLGAPFIPGVLTPSEVVRAQQGGARLQGNLGQQTHGVVRRQFLQVPFSKAA